MNKLPSSRTLLSIAVILVFLIFLIALLFITNLSFSVWEQLLAKPLWVQWAYGIVLLFISLLAGRLIWRLLLPAKKNRARAAKQQPAEQSIDKVAKRLDALQKQRPRITDTKPSELTAQSEPDSGPVLEPDSQLWEENVESSSELIALRKELSEFSQRREEARIYIALFGDISSGKSSLIQAMLGEKQGEDSDQKPNGKKNSVLQIDTSVLGGTTRSIDHYHWSINIDGNDTAEQSCILTDMPGLNEQFAELDILSTEEAVRVHLVIYLCDGDLTASQFKEVSRLLELGKPCIIAVNKSDQYTESERALILQNIRSRFSHFKNPPAVVSVQAGGMREFIRQTPNGHEERVQRPIEPDIQALKEQIIALLKQYPVSELEGLREKALASRLNERLDEMDARFKYSQSRRLVSGYTKKAVVASLATISPGSDILVQGYLGIQMIKDLCKIYGVSATDIDANKLLELIQSRMNKTLPLLLAIAGNGLKAFPGVGTVSGGLMHAVAYGMIFDTLGKSVARTLEVTGELSAQLISDVYKEQLSENIESRTKDLIRLALRLRKKD